MIFSSTVFMFIFLPMVLLVYFNPIFKGRQFRNIVLLLASLAFYTWAEPTFVFVMCAYIVLNWKLCIIMDEKEGRVRRNYMRFLVVCNLGLLFIFKYLSFVTKNLGLLFNNDDIVVNIALPIGISFFIFEIMSYMYDVYYGSCKAQKSLLNLAMYISMFPQILSGPIVRYGVVSNDIENRKETPDDFTEGVYRFVYGLGKKVIISNNIAIVADKAFELCGQGQLSAGMAYVGALAYMLQLYFDFAGYSDMAIGLGRIFGFKFNENFDYPYMSQSIAEYWRRWHMSLGTWFKDYVMYPVLRTEWMTKFREFVKVKWGKNASKMLPTIVATSIVWLLTGIWHGANWTYLLWGIYHGIFVMVPVIFKDTIKNFSKRHKWYDKWWARVLRIIRTMIIVCIGDIMFRAESVGQAFSYYAAMLGAGAKATLPYAQFYLWNYRYIFIFGIIGSYPLIGVLKKSKINQNVVSVVETIFLIAILVISISYLVRGSYNPFVYFNF